MEGGSGDDKGRRGRKKHLMRRPARKQRRWKGWMDVCSKYRWALEEEKASAF